MNDHARIGLILENQAEAHGARLTAIAILAGLLGDAKKLGLNDYQTSGLLGAVRELARSGYADLIAALGAEDPLRNR